MAEQFKKDDLEQIKSLKKEVESIQNELHNLPMTFDTVEGCTPERWDKHVITIRGKNVKRGIRLKAKLEITLDELEEKLTEMEDWLDTLPDSEIRTILRLKYRNGLTNDKIGRELGYSKSAISKKLTSFFRASEVSPNSPFCRANMES